MPMDFYSMPVSSPCRSVQLVARALDLQLNVKTVNLMKGEQMAPEYLKMNPQHTIPTLDDNGFILFESRAIQGYLVDQYGKTDTLYPKDPKKRAVVNQRLFFDSDTLYNRLGQYYGPVIRTGSKPDKAKAEKYEEAVGFLNSFLEGKSWVAGDQKTIADYSIVVSVSTGEAFGIPVNATKFPNVSAWYERAKKEIAGYEELNAGPARQFGEYFKSKAGTA